MKIPAKDLYKLLDVAPIASPEEISQKFKILARKYHPDTKTLPQEKERAKEIYQKLVEAFNILKDKEKRAEYDNLPIFRFKEIPKRKKKVAKKSEDIPWWKKIFLFGPPKEKKDSAKNAETTFSLGLQFAKNPNMLDQAILQFEAAYKQDPTLHEALFNIGLCYYKKGEFNKALEYFRKFKEKVPSDKQVDYLMMILKD